MTERIRYETIRDHILNTASQRVQMIKPTPMHIGSMVWKDEEQRTEEETKDIQAVGQGKGQTECYNCSGMGHMARECPNEMGTNGNPQGGGKGGAGFTGLQPKRRIRRISAHLTNVERGTYMRLMNMNRGMSAKGK